jgi:hypothetical protein
MILAAEFDRMAARLQALFGPARLGAAHGV